MKLIFASNIRFPTEKAHGLQIAQVAYECSKLGVQVEVWVPRRANKIKKDAFEYYSLPRNFVVRYIPCFDFFRYERLFGRLAHIFQSWSFARAVARESNGAHADSAIIYTRSPEVVFALRRKNKRVVYNAHNWPSRHHGLFRRLVRSACGIVANSRGTEEEFAGRGFARTVSIPNGVNISAFAIKESKEDLRRELDLPLDKKIVMYVGHLYAWKGVDTVILSLLPGEECIFLRCSTEKWKPA